MGTILKRALGKQEQVIKRLFDSLDSNLTRVFLPWMFRHPRYLRGAPRLVKAIKKSERDREKAIDEGFLVPPFLILSITPNCNLHCSGCFSIATGSTFNDGERAYETQIDHLGLEEWRSVIDEAQKLGVFGFVFAGGEPFMFPRLLELCFEFKDRFFIIITNGTTLIENDFSVLRKSDNIGVFVSLEGGRELTDLRRGEGVYEQAMMTLRKLSKLGVPSGVSVTISRLNYSYWMDSENLDSLVKQGIRLGLFIEYVPLSSNSFEGLSSIQGSADHGFNDEDSLIMDENQRCEFRDKIREYRNRNPLYIIHSPSDEEYLGGCVSAGKAFAHITPMGDLTPCPMSNIATHNVAKSTLKEGFSSPLFKEIRENQHLHEVEGVTCALYSNSKELERISKAVGAYKTGHGRLSRIE
jgi:MoaA/NifB/PqqE/SkfB family radical SAM enzyme